MIILGYRNVWFESNKWEKLIHYFKVLYLGWKLMIWTVVSAIVWLLTLLNVPNLNVENSFAKLVITILSFKLKNHNKYPNVLFADCKSFLLRNHLSNKKSTINLQNANIVSRCGSIKKFKDMKLDVTKEN